MTKHKLHASEIRRLIPNMGGCLATHRITVDGASVGRMVREAARNEVDSGWCFFAGDESQEYVDDPANISLYDVNTLANYAPDAIRFLTYPPGTTVVRGEDGKLMVTAADTPEPDVILMPAVGPGTTRVGRAWSFELSQPMFRRLDGDSLVLWRDGITAWIELDGLHGQSAAERLDEIQTGRSPQSYAEEAVVAGDITRYRYRLDEPGDGGTTQAAAYLFGLTSEAVIHLGIYFDSEELGREVDLIWSSLSALDID